MNLLSKYRSAQILKEEFSLGYFKIFYHYISGKPLVLKLNNNVETCFSSLGNVLSLFKLTQNKWAVLSASYDNLTIKGPEDVIIKCRTTTGFDFGHCVEIYLEKVYGEDFTLKNVIDIGMSNADSSIYFAKKGAKRVIGLEPDKNSYNLALYNIKQSKVDDIIIPINKALSNKQGEVDLIVYDNNPNANSINKNNMVKLNDSKHIETVETTTLENIITMFAGEDIHLLKMDCEGCEYSVLRSLGKESLKNILEIVLEYHHGLQDLGEILQKNGFNVKIVGNSHIGIVKAKREYS